MSIPGYDEVKSKHQMLYIQTTDEHKSSNEHKNLQPAYLCHINTKTAALRGANDQRKTEGNMYQMLKFCSKE